jgi:hypothetical protein
VARTVSPEALNIPDLSGETAQTSPPTPPLSGEFVFLYAAQADERAFEYPLGAKEDSANWCGGFTRVLAQTLQSTPVLTWEQAMQVAQAEIKAAGGSQTPDAVGPMLHAPVFGTVTPPAPRIATQGMLLQAGLLAGLHSGAELALFADPTSQDRVARAVITQITPRSATLQISEGAAPKTGFAEQIAPGLPAHVRFSTPMRADPGDGHSYEDLITMVAQIAKTNALDGVELNAQPFDIGLVLTDGVLALTKAVGVLDPYGLGTSARMGAADLAQSLDRAARVHRLRAALLPGGNSGMSALLQSQSQSGLAVEVGHRKATGDAEGCTAVSNREVRPVRDEHRIAPCDQLWVHLKNTSLTARAGKN